MQVGCSTSRGTCCEFCASAACQKRSILGLGIEAEVSEGPEIPDPVKMSGFISSESSMRGSRLEPGVVGKG